MEQPIDGILLIDKDESKTSFGVVRTVKSILNEPKTFKVGHAGTLDPFATGLLIILLGQATKCSRYIISERKEYQAIVRLGRETDTLDPTGKLVKEKIIPELTPEFVHKKTNLFIGKIEQIPPQFSALRYNGTRAYKLARRGLPVNLKKRTVTIYSINILSIQLPNILLNVTCSAGTYIRSLAADLGKKLGTVAMLTSLRREAIGFFKVNHAIRSNILDNREVDRSYLNDKIIPLRSTLPGMDEIELDKFLAKKIKNGYQPKWKELLKSGIRMGEKDHYFKLVKDQDLVAIAKNIKNDGKNQSEIKIERVFY